MNAPRARGTWSTCGARARWICPLVKAAVGICSGFAVGTTSLLLLIVVAAVVNDNDNPLKGGHPQCGKLRNRLYETVKIGGLILGKTSTGAVASKLWRYVGYPAVIVLMLLLRNLYLRFPLPLVGIVHKVLLE